MASQGAVALGGIVWGSAAQAAGVDITLLVAAATLTFSLILAIPLSINFTTSLSFDRPGSASLLTPLANSPQPRE